MCDRGKGSHRCLCLLQFTLASHQQLSGVSALAKPLRCIWRGVGVSVDLKWGEMSSGVQSGSGIFMGVPDAATPGLQPFFSFRTSSLGATALNHSRLAGITASANTEVSGSNALRNVAEEDCQPGRNNRLCKCFQRKDINSTCGPTSRMHTMRFSSTECKLHRAP